MAAYTFALSSKYATVEDSHAGKSPPVWPFTKSPLGPSIQGEMMMNATAAIGQELHSYIDMLSEHNLYTLKPIMSILAESAYIPETSLTEEEKVIIAEADREFEEPPENFVAIESISR
ncbi:MAG: hypothetical protein LBD44_01330 [Spirochaetaceae bacterium]|nr:hypothetical protein [Spirochaetaceae bacterium]